MNLNVQQIKGKWKAGWALDLHTIASSSHPFYKHTELGDMLYQLKYRSDRSKIEPIAAMAANFIKDRYVYPDLSAIIPIPPSQLDRPFQPVIELARSIGSKVNLSVPLDYLIKTKQTTALKNISDTVSRRELLKGAFRVSDERFARKDVLLFDDLFRSGETLNAVTEVLLSQGKVGKVFILVLTKTRTKR